MLISIVKIFFEDDFTAFYDIWNLFIEGRFDFNSSKYSLHIFGNLTVSSFTPLSPDFMSLEEPWRLPGDFVDGFIIDNSTWIDIYISCSDVCSISNFSQSHYSVSGTLHAQVNIPIRLNRSLGYLLKDSVGRKKSFLVSYQKQMLLNATIFIRVPI